MKKIISIITALMCTSSLLLPMATFATEISNLNSYYDLNKDMEYTISDAVLAKQLLNEGRFSKQDFLNVCNLIVGDEIHIEFEEFDIEGMEVSDASISKLQSIISSECIDYNFDGITVTYRYLNNGVITEIHCSDIGISETTIAYPMYNNIQNVIGISPEGTFCIDAYRSFDLPHEFNAYEVWDLDDVTPAFANSLLYTSGAYENFIVTPVTPQNTYVQIWFNNGVTITELNINRIAPIEKELRSFIYEGEEITIGVTADGTIAVDTYSFDIAD